MKPFKFQDEAVTNALNLLAKHKSVLLVSATGSGKTVISGRILKELKSKGQILCVVNLQCLIGQTVRELEELGLKVSVIHNEIVEDHLGKFDIGWHGDVVVTMPDTFRNSLEGKNDLAFDQKFNPYIIWFDEAHKATSEMFQFIRNTYMDSKILGTTATPYRDQNKEGEHLDEWYEVRITTVSIEEMIELGRLVRPEYMVFDDTKNVVKNWLTVTKNRHNKSTILFPHDTKAAMAYLDAFIQAGIPAEVVTSGSDLVKVDGKSLQPQTPKQRREINKRFESGETTVLISHSALCEGWNSKRAEICILARKMGTPSIYDQSVGRVMRAWETPHYIKKSCLVMDFSGNVMDPRLGKVEDRNWDEVGTGRDILVAKSKSTISKDSFDERRVVYHKCDNCGHVYNVKKSLVCNAEDCGTPMNITIMGNMKTHVLDVLKPKNNDHLENMIRNIITAKNSNTLQIVRSINKQAGKEILDIDGSINTAYKYLEKLAGLKAKEVKKTAKIVIN